MDRNACCLWITKVLKKGTEYFKRPTDKSLASLERAVSKSWGAMDDVCWGIPAENIAAALNKIREVLAQGVEQDRKKANKVTVELLTIFANQVVEKLSKYSRVIWVETKTLSGDIHVTDNYFNEVLENEEERKTQKIDEQMYSALKKLVDVAWVDPLLAVEREMEGVLSRRSIAELWCISHERTIAEHLRLSSFEKEKERIAKTKKEHLSLVLSIAIKVYGIEKMSSWLVDFLGGK